MVKKTILVAEDDKLISKAYQDGLSSAGFDVDSAVDGQEALKKIGTGNFNIVLLDLRMPKKDGFQVLEELSSSGLIKKINVIVSSNLDQDKDIERCMKLGAKDYIVKANFSIEDIIKTINKYK